MRRSSKLVLTIACCISHWMGSSARAAASPSADDMAGFADRLFATRAISEVAIAPDAARVAWVESLADGNTAVWIAERADPAHRVRVSAGRDAHESGIAWAPDGRHLVFLSDVEDGLQIYLGAPDGGPARRLTHTTGFLRGPRFSADGRTLAVLHTAVATADYGPTKAQPRDVGVIGEAVDPQRLAVVDLETGALRDLSPAALDVYEFDVAPDGGRFAIVAAPPPGNANWWVARLHLLDASTGEVAALYTPRLQIAVPRFSPDGRDVAVIHGLMSDQDVVGGEIVLLAADGRRIAPRVLTAGRPTSVAWLAWSAAGDLVWAEHDRGGVALAAARRVPRSAAFDEPTILWRGDEFLSADAEVSPSFSLAADGRTMALSRDAFDRAPEVWSGTPGAWQQVTHENTALRSEWGKAHSVTWSSDGGERQGWLLEPAGFDPARRDTRYPLAVWVHGGPSSQVVPHWPSAWAVARAIALSRRGYFLFFPNVRGSYGRGAEFTAANVKDFGGGDLRDLLSGVDRVERDWPVDPKRLGIAGWSYGGFFTMWTVTQTRRFGAAMAGAGIANWQSYYGQNGISTWMVPFFGAAVYDDPAVYAKSSPINFIRQVRTPTLLLVGESDAEVPAPQSFEFWRALRFLGVPTQLVVFPGEGHAITQPANRRDLMRRLVDWFDTHLPPTERR